MKKKLGKIKLNILAGKATPAPPVGPLLGQKNLNIIEFCKKFNQLSFNLEGIIPVVIIYYNDNSYDFFLKKSSTSYLIKKNLNLDNLNVKFIDKLDKLNFFFILNIVRIKINDLNSINLFCCFKTILGSIKSYKLNYDKFKI